MVRSRTRFLTLGLVLAASLILAALTTGAYLQARGLPYFEAYQINRHQLIIEGNAGNPWQYRVLSAYLVEGLIRLLQAFGLSGPHILAFFIFRFGQDTAIFLVAVLYFRKLGISLPLAMLGIVILAWAMSYSHYDSDLQFSTFFDVLFYLLAGIAIISKRSLWILTITVLAAVNRETSGLIPFMYLAAALVVPPTTSRARAISAFGLSLGLYVLVFVGLRLAYGEQALITPYGYAPGLPLLRYNLFRTITWWQCLVTLSVVPLVALVGYRNWPAQVRVFFWVVVPIWLLIHIVAAIMAETRLLLVPQALVFIPGALAFAQTASRVDTKSRARDL